MNLFDADAAKSYYDSLVLPSWAPEPWVFGAVWTPLYVIIALTFGYVFWQAIKGRIPSSVALPFGINLVLNLVWQPLQLALQNLVLDSVLILLVVASLVWALRTTWNMPGYRWVSIANVPYLLWGVFATTLQITTTVLTLMSRAAG